MVFSSPLFCSSCPIAVRCIRQPSKGGCWACCPRFGLPCPLAPASLGLGQPTWACAGQASCRERQPLASSPAARRRQVACSAAAGSAGTEGGAGICKHIMRASTEWAGKDGTSYRTSLVSHCPAAPLGGIQLWQYPPFSMAAPFVATGKQSLKRPSNSFNDQVPSNQQHASTWMNSIFEAVTWHRCVRHRSAQCTATLHEIGDGALHVGACTQQQRLMPAMAGAEQPRVARGWRAHIRPSRGCCH